MMSETVIIREKQERLLEILKRFDAFAQENGIRYYAASGTCLGAIREKGFIAWDGDIDIIMMKSMYDRCEQLLMNKGYAGIQWLSYKSDAAAPNLMGRIFEPKIRIENIEEYPYIDLFALVGAPRNKLMQDVFIKRSLMNYRIFWLKKRSYKNSLYRRHSKIGYVFQKILFGYPLHWCIRRFESEMVRFHYEDTGIVAPLTGQYGRRECMPADWFEEEPEYVSFCDTKIPVLANWDEYLKLMYGTDYMIPKQYKRYR